MNGAQLEEALRLADRKIGRLEVQVEWLMRASNSRYCHGCSVVAQEKIEGGWPVCVDCVAQARVKGAEDGVRALLRSVDEEVRW